VVEGSFCSVMKADVRQIGVTIGQIGLTIGHIDLSLDKKNDVTASTLGHIDLSNANLTLRVFLSRVQSN
jgi:hypothetical protein